MAQEKEQKIKLLIPLKNFEQRLLDNGFSIKDTIVQTDIYFDKLDWYLYRHIAALRIRMVNEKPDSFAFQKVFYTPNRENKYYIEELETSFANIDYKMVAEIFKKIQINIELKKIDSVKLTKLLLENGFQDEQKTTKTRKTYFKKDLEITIDEVEYVGTVIEFETKTSEPKDEIEKVLKSNEWERGGFGTGYVWLEKVKGFTDHLTHFDRLKQNPLWNVWEHEKNFYNSINISK